MNHFINGGLMLGTPLGWKKPLQVSLEPHTMILGPSGALKTGGVILPNLINLTGVSMIVLDIKGSLSRATAGYRQFCGSDIVNIDPANFAGLGIRTPLNPLVGEAFSFDNPNLVTNVDMMTEIICPAERGDRDVFFTSQAQDLASAVLLYECAANPKTASLIDIRRFACQPIKEIGAKARKMAAFAKKHCFDALFNKIAPYRDIEAGSKAMQDVLATLKSRTKWMDDTDLKLDLKSDTGLDFARLKERPTTAFLTIPADRLEIYAPWSKVIMAKALNDLLRGPAGSVPVMIVLDEAAQASFPLLEKRLPLLREYGISVLSVFQDTSSGELALGRERFKSWMNNSRNLVVFRTNDPSTADLMSKRSGQRTTIGYGLSNNKLSLHAISRPHIRPEQFMNMPKGTAVVMTEETDGLIVSQFQHARAMPEVAERLDWPVWDETTGNDLQDAAE